MALMGRAGTELVCISVFLLRIRTLIHFDSILYKKLFFGVVSPGSRPRVATKQSDSLVVVEARGLLKRNNNPIRSFHSMSQSQSQSNVLSFSGWVEKGIQYPTPKGIID
jgi:hypothetical protein